MNLTASDGVAVDKDTIGRWGEHLAAEWLRGHGRKILYRNYRAPQGGEVDIDPGRAELLGRRVIRQFGGQLPHAARDPGRGTVLVGAGEHAVHEVVDDLLPLPGGQLGQLVHDERLLDRGSVPGDRAEHRAAQPHPAAAHVLVKAVREAILRLRVMLRPEIAERVRAAQLQGHAVIDHPLGKRVWAVEPIAAVDLGAHQVRPEADHRRI